MGKSITQEPPQTQARRGRGRSRRGEGQLEQLAGETGQTILEVVKEAVRKEGSVYGAAQALSVSPNTVSYHLRKAGLWFRPITTVEFYPVEEAVRA